MPASRTNVNRSVDEVRSPTIRNTSGRCFPGRRSSRPSTITPWRQGGTVVRTEVANWNCWKFPPASAGGRIGRQARDRSRAARLGVPLSRVPIRIHGNNCAGESELRAAMPRQARLSFDEIGHIDRSRGCEVLVETSGTEFDGIVAATALPNQPTSLTWPSGAVKGDGTGCHRLSLFALGLPSRERSQGLPTTNHTNRTNDGMPRIADAWT